MKLIKHNNAFTLVELLVVMSIIALLIAILLPVLSRVRAQARTAVCANNDHQIGLALGNYISEYNGVFPPELGYPWLARTELNNWGTGISWQHCLVNPANPAASVTQHKGDRSLTAIRCPSWPKALGGFAQDFATTGGYALNDNLDGMYSWQFIPGADSVKLKQLYITPNIAKIRNATTKLCVLETTAIEDPLNPGTASSSKDTVESWGWLDTVPGSTMYKYRGWLRIDHGQYPLSSPFTMKNPKVLPKDRLMNQKLNCLFADQHGETVTLKSISENTKMWLPYN